MNMSPSIQGTHDYCLHNDEYFVVIAVKDDSRSFSHASRALMSTSNFLQELLMWFLGGKMQLRCCQGKGQTKLSNVATKIEPENPTGFLVFLIHDYPSKLLIPYFVVHEPSASRHATCRQA